MNNRGTGDAFAFQRLLWLLVGTVIVPTVLLSLYGVMAIRNQQAAIQEQVRQGQAERLQFAAQIIFDQVASADVSVRGVLQTCTSHCEPPIPGVAEVWTWSDKPPTGLNPPKAADNTTWFRPADGGETVGIFQTSEGYAAWRLNPEALIASVQTHAQQRYNDGVHFELRERSVGPSTPMEELVQRWESDDFEASAPLERPLAQWEVVVTYPDNDPARTILGASSWLYPLGLVALVATVMAGTVITLNSAAREIRLSRLQTDFVSSVSHELRTPLTSIRMFVETLQSGRIEDPERVAECLDLLSQETDRLSRMIERMLSWARMEAGRRVYEVHPVRVEDLVQDALSAFRSQRMMEEEVNIDVQLPEQLPSLLVDADAIVEALVNLLQNAVKHTEAPRDIRITTELGGKQLALSVVDNGPGIPLADRKRVFEKFYQSDTRLSSPTGANRGSGLGLSIVRAIVQGHGGRVDLKSEEGEGSEFTLWLPVS